MPIPNNGTVEDVINLLNQTQGINQKLELAGVIGDPAKPTDNISTQIGILEDGKGQIAEAINNKGGSASGSDTFSELSQAIEDLPSGSNEITMELQVSSGVLQFNNTTNTTVNCRYVTITNLGFIPSKIIAYYNNYIDISTYVKGKLAGSYEIVGIGTQYLRVTGNLIINSNNIVLPLNNAYSGSTVTYATVHIFE